MSDGFEAAALGGLCLFCAILFWNLGYQVGEGVERAKVVASEDYVKDIRALDATNKKARELEEKIK